MGVSLVHEEIIGRGEQVQVLILGNGLALARRVLPLMIRADSGSVLLTDDAPVEVERLLGERLRGTSVTVSRLAPLTPDTDPEEYARSAIDAMMVAEVQSLSRAL